MPAVFGNENPNEASAAPMENNSDLQPYQDDTLLMQTAEQHVDGTPELTLSNNSEIIARDPYDEPGYVPNEEHALERAVAEKTEMENSETLPIDTDATLSPSEETEEGYAEDDFVNGAAVGEQVAEVSEKESNTGAVPLAEVAEASGSDISALPAADVADASESVTGAVPSEDVAESSLNPQAAEVIPVPTSQLPADYLESTPPKGVAAESVPDFGPYDETIVIPIPSTVSDGDNDNLIVTEARPVQQQDSVVHPHEIIAAPPSAPTALSSSQVVSEVSKHEPEQVQDKQSSTADENINTHTVASSTATATGLNDESNRTADSVTGGVSGPVSSVETDKQQQLGITPVLPVSGATITNLDNTNTTSLIVNGGDSDSTAANDTSNNTAVNSSRELIDSNKELRLSLKDLADKWSLGGILQGLGDVYQGSGDAPHHDDMHHHHYAVLQSLPYLTNVGGPQKSAISIEIPEVHGEGFDNLNNTVKSKSARDLVKEEIEIAQNQSKMTTLVVVGLMGFVFFVLSIIEARIVSSKIPLPTSVAFFLVGVIVSLLSSSLRAKNWNSNEEMWNISKWFLEGVYLIEQMNQSFIFFLILPICLYESASSIHFHTFKRVLPSSLVLAVPGVVINTILVGTFFRYYFSSIYNWPQAFLVGSVLSATDPVSVVTALRSLRAPPRLAVILEGESLLNDGTAVVFFELFMGILLGKNNGGFAIFAEFVRLSLLGPLIGFLAALICYIWLRSVQRNYVVQVVFLVGVFYFLTFVSEYLLGASSVLTVVTFGLSVAGFTKAGFSRATLSLHRHFMEVCSCLANQALFFLAGIVAAKYFRSIDVTYQLGVDMLFVYLACMVTRFVVIALFSPVLARLGYGMGTKEGVVLFWGCLRGGVALCLAIVVDNKNLEEQFKQHATFCIAAFTMLTLLINGITFEWVYKLLKLYPLSSTRRKLFTQYARNIDAKFMHHVDNFEGAWFDGSSVLRVVRHSGVIPQLSEAALTGSGNLQMPLNDPHYVLPKALLDLHYFREDGTCCEEARRTFKQLVQGPGLNPLNRGRNTAMLVRESLEAAPRVGAAHRPSIMQTPYFESAADVLEVVMSTAKQIHHRLYLERAIEAETQLILDNAADKALDVLSSADGHASVFRVQWLKLRGDLVHASILESLSSRYVGPLDPKSESPSLFEMIPLVGQSRFNAVYRSVDVLFGYTTACEELLYNVEGEDGLPKTSALEQFIGKNMMQQLKRCSAEAKLALGYLFDIHPWKSFNAILKIHVSLLLCDQRQMVSSSTKEDIVLNDDVEKLADLLHSHQLTVARYTPPRIPSGFTTGIPPTKDLPKTGVPGSSGGNKLLPVSDAERGPITTVMSPTPHCTAVKVLPPPAPLLP
eukprot:Lankesteria_metandrocarpae@DN3994_c0_g1_i2.p1